MAIEPQPVDAAAGRERFRKILLLRAMLVIAAGGLLLDAEGGAAGFGAAVLLLAFAVSDVLLAAVPFEFTTKARFELVIGGFDLILVGLGIHLAGAASGALPVSCLLMAIIVALGNNKANTVAGAVGVGAVHAWLLLTFGTGADLGRQLVLQTVFLCSVGLYYGFLTEGIHLLRRKKEAEALEHRELNTLLDILETVTSSLDLATVTRGIVAKLNTIVPSMRCSILYVDKSMSRCSVMAAHDNPDLDNLEVDLEKYPEVRAAIDSRSPVIIRDVANDPLMDGVRERIKNLNFKSVIVIPITFGEDLLGTLCLKSARTRDEYSEREVSFCAAVAGASANALKNAFLHRQMVEESTRRRETSEKLARILNHSPDLILTTDDAGRINEFNRGAERLLGHTRDQVTGRPVACLMAGDGNRDIIESVLDAGVLPSHAARFTKSDGTEVEMELHISAIKDEVGETAGTLWIGRDVTELRSAQLQLIQSEKLSTIGEIISGVAHELNNPLSGVLGFAQLMMARHRTTPLARELERIYDSAQRCQKIVRNLLSFAREHKPERKFLGVNGIIQKTLDLKKYQLRVNDIEVVLDLDKELPCTMLDFHHMQQVLLNLINNAQYAMAAVRERRHGRLVVRSTWERSKIRVELQDNGEGMDRATLDRIFDPFFTTKPAGEGTGLGLSVSYGIVREHGGRIQARSRPGDGTTFVIELPILKEEKQADDPAALEYRDPAQAAGGGRILVVDDEPMILDLLMDVLEDDGHKVDTANNGSEAWRKINDQGYDMVITDVRMPQMNGLDFYRNVLSSRPELEGKVVFITGDLMDSETVQFLAQVEAPTLAKPLEIAEITEVVQKTLKPADQPEI